jgi:hypothetical protein
VGRGAFVAADGPQVAVHGADVSAQCARAEVAADSREVATRGCDGAGSDGDSAVLEVRSATVAALNEETT